LGPSFGVGPSFLYSDQGVATHSPTAFCAVPAQNAGGSRSPSVVSAPVGGFGSPPAHLLGPLSSGSGPSLFLTVVEDGWLNARLPGINVHGVDSIGPNSAAV